VELPQVVCLVVEALAAVSVRSQTLALLLEAVMKSVGEEALNQQMAVLTPVPVDISGCCVEQLVVLERGRQVVADTAQPPKYAVAYLEVRLAYKSFVR
jgi:hypothetical protein